MSKDIILVKLGYNFYAIKGTPALAGKLLELLSPAVEVRFDLDGSRSNGRRLETYRCEAEPVDLKVELIDTKQLLPPKPAASEDSNVVELPTLTGAVRLLKP